MVIQYCSDLHLEFIQNKKFILKNPLVPKGDVLLLAGDISPFVAIGEHKDFFDFIADNFLCTYWVPGNHEYYSADIAGKSGQINQAIRSNIFLVNNQVIKLNEVQLIFSTLWSDISVADPVVIQKRIADFTMIKNGNRLFTPQDYYQLHLQSKNFISEALSNKVITPTMVVTHHVPTFLHYPEKYKKDILSVAFATELDELVHNSTIDYWLYGHHHFNTPQFAVGKTKFITNQLGYIKYRGQKGFSNDAVITFA